MNTNYDFIKDERLSDIKDLYIESEQSLKISPSIAAVMCRRTLEVAVKFVYGIDGDLEIPYQQTLSTLIHNSDFRQIINDNLFKKIKFIKDLGNESAHSKLKVSESSAILALRNLHDFILWICYSYSDDYEEHEFDEQLISTTKDITSLEQETKRLLEELKDKTKTIEELQIKYNDIRSSKALERKDKENLIPFNIKDISEYETRKMYIDLDLQIAGWRKNDNWMDEVEVNGMPNSQIKGFVDYVLYGANGKPLAVVEAKRTTRDPKVAQHQAKLYADCLEEMTGQRPIIYFTNGFEHYMWDDKNYPPRRVSGFYTQDELQLIVDRRTMRGDLKNIVVNQDIAGRYYQIEAARAFCDDLMNSKRKGLLVMATGTGKTRTAASIVDILTSKNWVKNVLFLADRTELVKQAKKSFEKTMSSLSTINLTLDKNNPENARMVFSTYQTMMNAIDDVKRKDGNKLFTPGHFDLIIIDEAHRSIYKKYQAIFEYFDGILLGLTATPRSEIDKNTYSIFDLADNVPTYYYEYEQAVADGYLVNYHVIETPTKFLDRGIKYSELSDRDKEEFEDTFAGDDTIIDEVKVSAIHTWLFNESTVDKVLETLMDKGLKVEGNDKLGKTIIFAKNHDHAEFIEKRFNKLYPQYKGEFAQVIDIKTEYVSDRIEKFGDYNRMPQIAISVDMLDTGIDVPEVVNLVFFKDVKSKVKFLQMIGRGTRLCPDLFGYKKDKTEFYIFDVCNNFKFFEQNPNGKETVSSLGISQLIFELKVDLIRELNKGILDDEELQNYKEFLIDELSDLVANMNTLKFDVRQKIRYVEKYKEKVNWSNLSQLDVMEIKKNITSLVMSNDNDESAKHFDRLMLYVMVSKLMNVKYDREIHRLNHLGDSLIKISNVLSPTQVECAKMIRDNNYVLKSNIIDLENIRKTLRDVIKMIPKIDRPIIETIFNDEISIIDRGEVKLPGYEFEDYKKKVEFYLRNHLDNKIVNKIRNNEEISVDDINELQKVLFNDLNSNQDEFNNNYNDQSLVYLVRRTVGLSPEAIEREFAKFSNEYELNIEQTRFINLIKNYILQNGVIDKKLLNEDPFTNYGSILELFNGNLNIVQVLVAIIDMINGKGCFKEQEE